MCPNGTLRKEEEEMKKGQRKEREREGEQGERCVGFSSCCLSVI